MSFRNTKDAQRSVVEQVADYITGMRTKSVDKETSLQVDCCTFDLLIAAAAGVNESGPIAARETALDLYRPGSVPIWFTDDTSSAFGAAYTNSAAAAVLDLDDGSRPARGHVGAAVIPVALAISAETNASVLQRRKAIKIGHQVAITVGAARKCFGYSITWCTFGVVATAAYLLELSAAQIEYALGIAGEHIPTRNPVETPRLEGSDTKEGIPWSVAAGIQAVYLAKNGHTGARNILDVEERYNFSDDLGLDGKPHIFNIYFKLYACCRYIHAPIDALLAAIKDHGIAIEDITSVKIHTIASAVRLENRTVPSNLTDVVYGTQYCVSLVALHGPEMLLPLTTKVLSRSDVSALAEKMEVLLDETVDAHFPEKTLARAEITANGKSYMSAVTAPRGEATDPLTWEEIENKGRKAMRLVATHQQQEALFNAMLELRDNDRIEPLLIVIAQPLN